MITFTSVYECMSCNAARYHLFLTYVGKRLLVIWVSQFESWQLRIVQVAETFEMQLDDVDNLDRPLLRDLAMLDACITVIDASNLMVNLQSIKTIKVIG